MYVCIYMEYICEYIYTPKIRLLFLQVCSTPSVRSCRQTFNLNLNEFCKSFKQ